MTKQKTFKERIRARMDKTGESYTTARRQLIEKSETEARKRRTPKTVSPVRSNEARLEEKTGRGYDEWFKLLDKAGAKDKKHSEMVKWLSTEHGVDGWWCQHLTVAYEQDRGLRAPGQKFDGTYSISASKTVEASIKKLFDAFENQDVRESWLGEYDFEIRTTRPSKSITARWEDGSTRLTIAFIDKGKAKSQVALAHERLPDAQQADEIKAFWRERLVLLKKLLES